MNVISRYPGSKTRTTSKRGGVHLLTFRSDGLVLPTLTLRVGVSHCDQVCVHGPTDDCPNSETGSLIEGSTGKEIRTSDRLVLLVLFIY